MVIMIGSAKRNIDDMFPRYLEIRSLLKHGADQTLRDSFGRLPLDMTQNENVRVLLDNPS